MRGGDRDKPPDTTVLSVWTEALSHGCKSQNNRELQDDEEWQRPQQIYKTICLEGSKGRERQETPSVPLVLQTECFSHISDLF